MDNRFTFFSVADLKSLEDGRIMCKELMARGESPAQVEQWGLSLRERNVVLQAEHYTYKIMIGASFMILAAREFMTGQS